MIGLFTQEDGKTNIDNEAGDEMVYGLTRFMMEQFESLQCYHLSEMQIDEYENPCHRIVEVIAMKLEEMLSSSESISKVNSWVPLSN